MPSAPWLWVCGGRNLQASPILLPSPQLSVSDCLGGLAMRQRAGQTAGGRGGQLEGYCNNPSKNVPKQELWP